MTTGAPQKLKNRNHFPVKTLHLRVTGLSWQQHSSVWKLFQWEDDYFCLKMKSKEVHECKEAFKRETVFFHRGILENHSLVNV